MGNINLDDVIEEYYQRSIQYHNVTNCPLDFPFYDGQQCMNCSSPSLPLFNMQTKACDACPFDTSVDLDLRKCIPMPHNSDYTKSNNYNLDGATSLPTPDPKLTPCPR